MKRASEESIGRDDCTFLDSVVFYAVKNKKAKFMIPFEKNEFDSGFFFFEKVMIDSGCSTMSMPYPTSMPFEKFYDHYKNYKWDISRAVGTGMLPRLRLSISGDTERSFNIKVGSLNGKTPPTTKWLRFILPYDIIEEISKRDLFKEKPYAKELIDEHRKFIEEHADKIPALKEKPKDLVLIGQEILKNYYLVQLEHVCLVLEKKNKNFSFRPEIIENQYEKVYRNFENDHKEIYDFFDETHEGDYFNCSSPLFISLEEDYKK